MHLRPSLQICLAALCSLLFATGLSAELRTFQNDDGSSIRAEIMSVNRAEQVTLKRDDGRIFRDVPIEMFSSPDRKYIRKWKRKLEEALNNADLTPDSDIKVEVSTGKSGGRDRTYSYEVHIEQYEPKVRIHNDEIKKTYTEVKGHLVMIGNDVRRKDKYGVFISEKFKLDLPPGEYVEHHAKGFSTKYYPDYGGQEYAGYLLVLFNRGGEPVYIKGSLSKWEENWENVLNAKTHDSYNREFEYETGDVIRYTY